MGSKEVTIAAPASYWYLKGFPIAKMAPLVDYVIYMTYDLHGQVSLGKRQAPRGIQYANLLFLGQSGMQAISGHSWVALPVTACAPT